MPIKNDREYRTIAQDFNLGDEENEYRVSGYASTFDTYTLWHDPDTGIDYQERISPQAFDGADMSDVIMQYDHNGKVFARTSNDTLTLYCDEHGLAVRADLSSTPASREFFQEIKSGLLPQMSFAFTVAQDHYERDTHTRVIDKFRKIYDVSAVSFPANPNTEIGASYRDYFHGEMEKEKAERLEREARAKAEIDKAMKLYEYEKIKGGNNA